MTDEPTGTPEGRRILQLLWDPPSPAVGRGPKPRTTLTDVVAAGVALADAEGLAALSIRKVAQRLDLGAMSLYTYVPGRTELVELMIDHVYGEWRLLPGGELWRARLEHWCRQTWQLYGRHPWLLEYNAARLPIAPHVLDVDEALYSALLDAGFTGTRNVALANLLRWQLLGAARSTISDADEARRTGISAEAYWEARSSFWTTYFDDQRYPAMAAVWEAGGFDDPDGWDVEPLITRLLDGIERIREETVAALDQPRP